MLRESSNSAADTTREALIGAAIRLFGRQGFEATSVRQIVSEAGGQNVALISYHFGSKSGLRHACVEVISQQLEAVFAVRDDASEPATPEDASRRLEDVLSTVLAFLLQAPHAEDYVAFMLREIAEPSEILDQFYDRFIEEQHASLCRLWSLATGMPAESAETRLAVFSAIGQVIYFRIGRPIVRRRMGWSSVGPDEAARIGATIRRNLRALITEYSEIE